ncbi:MAG TPA: S8 family peptidase [Thiobacillaceae bacterium]|nr:S8 family peptidase [Thiobacillaceae bacterium]
MATAIPTLSHLERPMPTRPIPALVPLALALALAWTGQAHAVQGLQSDDTAPIPGRLLVKFKAEADAVAAETGARDQGVSEVRRLRGGDNARTAVARRWRVMGFSSQESLARMMDRVARLPGVESVEPDYPVRATGIPNDSRFSELWGLNNTGQTGGTADADIDAPEAWDILAGGAVLVAVVDTGVDYTHPDLAANIWTNPGEIAGNGIDDDGNGYVDDVRGWDFANNDNNPMDDNDHGTHVSGTIAAQGDNGQGVVGVNRLARIMPLKFLNAAGTGATSDAVEAIYYAIDKGAKVMNHSWGGGAYSQSLADAFTAAQNANIVMVVAAGNDGKNIDTSPSYPAAMTHANIVSVAATTSTDARASYSNYGATAVDLAAPGDAILSSIPGATYASFSGTSMASPHVAGAASLLLAANPALTYAQVKSAILDHVDANAAMAGKSVTGGRLNLKAALASVSAPPPANLPPAANAGADLNLARGATAVLSGANSTDPDGSVVAYSWVSAKPSVVKIMSGASTAAPTIKAAPKARVGSTVTLTLTVTDDDGATASDQLVVTVK